MGLKLTPVKHQMWVDFPEPLSAGLVYRVSFSRLHQGEKAVIWVVGILNNTPSLSLTPPAVNVL